MEILPKQPSVKVAAENFTGDVWMDPVFHGEALSRLRANVIRFAPGARTAWHSHAGGQTLYVTDGKGRVQSRGAGILEIQAGDVVRTPADEWHWHGADPDRFMTHLSLTEGIGSTDRPETEWGEHVAEAEYRGSTA